MDLSSLTDACVGGVVPQAERAGKTEWSRAYSSNYLVECLGTEYLRVYWRQLRNKLERDPERPQYMVTEPGSGYRFIADE